MLRTTLEKSLKDALLAREERAVSTLRLILAALKDRDIVERGKGNPDGLDDAQILGLLQSMIKQRHDSIALYRQGNRPDLAQQEAEEIAVINRFLPPQLSEAETAAAVDEAIGAVGATALKDMGRVMAMLKERFQGQMDFSVACTLVKKRLAG